MLDSLLLGVVEGIAECLPISSTAHLLLMERLLRVESSFASRVLTQLGSTAALFFYYRAQIYQLLTRRYTFFRALSLGLAVVPLVLVTLILPEGFVELLHQAPLVIPASLIAGGIIMLQIERWSQCTMHPFSRTVSFQQSIIIGCLQTLAIIPGVSRSGATILCAIVLRIDRRSAIEFSFMLSILVGMMATGYTFVKHPDPLLFSSTHLVAAVGAFLGTTFFIKNAIHLMEKYGFVGLALYRIFLGTFLIACGSLLR